MTIKLKAAFLVAVFALNTAVGFACAVGLNMGFNSHHHEEEVTEIQESSHHHGKSPHHEAGDHKSKDDKDSCCNDKVIKLEQFDKAVPPSSNATVSPLFFATLISSFYSIDVLYPSQATPSIKYFARSYHPPIPDIRIAIQSFQI